MQATAYLAPPLVPSMVVGGALVVVAILLSLLGVAFLDPHIRHKLLMHSEVQRSFRSLNLLALSFGRSLLFTAGGLALMLISSAAPVPHVSVEWQGQTYDLGALAERTGQLTGIFLFVVGLLQMALSTVVDFLVHMVPWRLFALSARAMSRAFHWAGSAMGAGWLNPKRSTQDPSGRLDSPPQRRRQSQQAARAPAPAQPSAGTPLLVEEFRTPQRFSGPAQSSAEEALRSDRSESK